MLICGGSAACDNRRLADTASNLICHTAAHLRTIACTASLLRLRRIFSFCVVRGGRARTKPVTSFWSLFFSVHAALGSSSVARRSVRHYKILNVKDRSTYRRIIFLLHNIIDITNFNLTYHQNNLPKIYVGS